MAQYYDENGRPQDFMGLSPTELEARIDDTLPPLILVGDSPTKRQDYAIASTLFPDARVMTVNNAACQCPEIKPDYLATFHGGKKDFIGTPRMPLEWIPSKCIVICENKSGWEHERVNLIYHGNGINGTSALFAILSAVYIGYGRILICGCDMQTEIYGNDTTFGSWRKWAPMLCRHAIPIRGKLIPIFEEARDNATLQRAES